MIIILAGVLPLTAAGSTTEAGKATFYKTTAWLLAFVLYKPVAAIIYAAAFFTGGQGDTGISWDDAGPIASQEFWGALRHDSGVSVTWAMEEAPRGAVLSGVLTQLVSPHPQLPRKRVTLIYRPHSPGEAAKIVDSDVRDAIFNATKNARATARVSADLRAAEQSAGEEASGSGVVRFAMLLTVTVPTSEQLAATEAVVRTLAATARIRLRRVYGSQSAAFAASLGVGVLLPHHASVGSLLTG